jgi:hypothetical protein
LPLQTIELGEKADKSHWPKGVRPITIDQMDKLGVDPDSGALYWDRKEVVTRSVVRLGRTELWFAGIATFSTLGMLLLAIGGAAGWWGSP